MNDTTATVYPANSGFIWIPTLQGINRLDPVIGIFKPYPSKPGDLSTPAGYFCVSMKRPGGIWFLTVENPALNLYDSHRDSFSRYENESKDERGLAIEYGVSCVFVDRTGLVWVGSVGSGLFKQSRVK